MSVSPLRRLSRIAVALTVAASAVGVATVAPAQATVVSLSACDGSSLTQPFSQWADYSFYKLAPGGDFEGSLTGWSLGGGAQQVSGSESYGVTGSAGAYSLSLPAGASAQSPYTCVNAAYPSFRFFTQTSSLGGSVLVQAVYVDPVLGTVVIPVGVAAASGSWSPTPVMLTGSAVPGATNGGTAYIALRFTALTGSTRIDDVEVDPWRS